MARLGKRGSNVKTLLLCGPLVVASTVEFYSRALPRLLGIPNLFSGISFKNEWSLTTSTYTSASKSSLLASPTERKSWNAAFKEGLSQEGRRQSDKWNKSELGGEEAEMDRKLRGRDGIVRQKGSRKTRSFSFPIPVESRSKEAPGDVREDENSISYFKK